MPLFCTIIIIIRVLKRGDIMTTAKNFKKMGRPLAFSTVEELEEMIQKYYIRCEEKEKPLTMSGLALWLGISRQTLVNYSYKDDFFDTINIARGMVQADMEERGLSGNSNATMSIFSLKNNFGWVDKQEINANNNNTNLNKNIDLSNISTDDLKKLINEEEEDE